MLKNLLVIAFCALALNGCSAQEVKSVAAEVDTASMFSGLTSAKEMDAEKVKEEEQFLMDWLNVDDEEEQLNDVVEEFDGVDEVQDLVGDDSETEDVDETMLEGYDEDAIDDDESKEEGALDKLIKEAEDAEDAEDMSADASETQVREFDTAGLFCGKKCKRKKRDRRRGAAIRRRQEAAARAAAEKRRQAAVAAAAKARILKEQRAALATAKRLERLHNSAVKNRADKIFNQAASKRRAELAAQKRRNRAAARKAKSAYANLIRNFSCESLKKSVGFCANRRGGLGTLTSKWKNWGGRRLLSDSDAVTVDDDAIVEPVDADAIDEEETTVRMFDTAGLFCWKKCKKKKRRKRDAARQREKEAQIKAAKARMLENIGAGGGNHLINKKAVEAAAQRLAKTRLAKIKGAPSFGGGISRRQKCQMLRKEYSIMKNRGACDAANQEPDEPTLTRAEELRLQKRRLTCKRRNRKRRALGLKENCRVIEDDEFDDQPRNQAATVGLSSQMPASCPVGGDNSCVGESQCPMTMTCCGGNCYNPSDDSFPILYIAIIGGVAVLLIFAGICACMWNKGGGQRGAMYQGGDMGQFQSNPGLAYL